MSTDRDATLLEFPCAFPIKAVGRADIGFEALVVEIVSRHAPGLDQSTVKVRASSGGNWISVTLTIEATSKAQLDAIYRDLSTHARVAWAL
jgi:putative lipoic acid-binding regulatory protein